MSWIIGNWSHLGAVAVKAVLMYGIALIGLRMSERRTLAQWTLIDFATAVAIGAIVGRTAIAGTESFVTGAVALVTLLVVHRVMSMLRFHPAIERMTDHRIRVLVDHGRLRRGELRRCGLTDGDLFAQLRQKGIHRLEDLRYVLYEARGELTVVPETSIGSRDLGGLVEAGLSSAARPPAPCRESRRAGPGAR